MPISVYFSKRLNSWVRMERQEDGEYCHLSGFPNKYAAVENGRYSTLYGEPPLPEFLRETKPTMVGCFDKYGMPSFLSE
jgi:hypothetical protein